MEGKRKKRGITIFQLSFAEEQTRGVRSRNRETREAGADPFNLESTGQIPHGPINSPLSVPNLPPIGAFPFPLASISFVDPPIFVLRAAQRSAARP